jgi:hypothetical protein
MESRVIAIDLAKLVFEIAVADSTWRVIERHIAVDRGSAAHRPNRAPITKTTLVASGAALVVERSIRMLASVDANELAKKKSGRNAIWTRRPHSARPDQTFPAGRS